MRHIFSKQTFIVQERSIAIPMNPKLKSPDIIKGIGILMIIIVHNRHFMIWGEMSGLMQTVKQLINFGQMGCQLFFFISGFSLCYSWERMTAANPSKGFIPTSLHFIFRRYLRLIPGFLMIMAVNWLLNILLIDTPEFLGFLMNREPLAIITNILFIHGLFPDYINNVFPGGWYIGTTFLLYITFPLLFCTFKKLNRLPAVCMTAIPLLLLAFNYYLLRHISIVSAYELYPYNNSFLYFFFTNHLPCFSLGILLYFFEKKEFSAKCPLVISIPLFIVITYLCIHLYLLPEENYLYTFMPTIAGLAVYWLAAALIHVEKKRLSASKKYAHTLPSRFLVSCGQHSYGMYLVHSLICWYGLKTLRHFLTLDGKTYNELLVYWIVFIPSVFAVYGLGLCLEKLLSKIDRKLRPS